MNSSLFCEVDVCESTQWLVGVPGTCNATGVCECPSGYSGLHVLSATNDCHMNEKLKHGLNSITFVSAICALLGSIIALAKVLKELSRVYSPRIMPRILSRHEHSKEPFETSRPSQRHVIKRKLLVVRNILLFVCFASCEVYRAVILLQNPNAFAVEVPVHVVFVYCLGISSSTTSMFLFLYIYTTSLPRSEQLATVLGISHDERRYRKCKYLKSVENGLRRRASISSEVGLQI